MVTLVNAASAEGLDPGLAFLVAGSPTRAGKASGPIRKFIKRRVGKDWVGKPYAAFGTGMKDRGSEPQPKGADQVDKLLRDKGLLPLAGPFKAVMQGKKGPLEEGELDRATQFGRDLAASLRK